MGERYSRGYLYACKRPRLLKAVGDGDTLWLVTSRRRPDQILRYHLAYKLVDCIQADPSQEKLEQFGPYMVRARDWSRSVRLPPTMLATRCAGCVSSPAGRCGRRPTSGIG